MAPRRGEAHADGKTVVAPCWAAALPAVNHWTLLADALAYLRR
jgi:hypothetical protein